MPPYLVAVMLLLLVWMRRVDAQAITAPDQGDALEERAYDEHRHLLDDWLVGHADVDMSAYSFEAPTQFAIGLLLDPCRHHAPDCCIDRFGEPAYTTPTLAAKERIALLDESGALLQASASRLSDRPSVFDPDCYLDDLDQPYRLRKTLTARGLSVSREYNASGCVGRLRALAPMEAVVMPPCWDRNDSVDALADCAGVDARVQHTCVAVAYTQTAYIAQCGGQFALSDECGTFLEVHALENATILSQTRLLGEYPSGFRTTTLPLFFQGDRQRVLCEGDYEVWWVQRTRAQWIAQKRKRFRVLRPPCDFDSVSNTFKPFHTIVSA